MRYHRILLPLYKFYKFWHCQGNQEINPQFDYKDMQYMFLILQRRGPNYPQELYDNFNMDKLLRGHNHR